MILDDVLCKMFEKYCSKALDNVSDDNLYHENLGRMKMCNELCRILSNESLMMKVELDVEELLKGE